MKMGCLDRIKLFFDPPIIKDLSGFGVGFLLVLGLACAQPTQEPKTSRVAEVRADKTAAIEVAGSHPPRMVGEGIHRTARASTLVLYDTSGQWGFLGELYAQEVANLVSHFGPWEAKPVTRYLAGQMDAFSAVIYLGSTFDEPLPAAFMNDLKASTIPVIWSGANLWRLTKGDGKFVRKLGWTLRGNDASPLTQVEYKGIRLDRSPLNKGGIGKAVIDDPSHAHILATVFRSDGSSLPWAIRSGNFTYLSEIPLSYVGPSDRYLIFADLLFDALAPATVTRHRALVRIEDVGPESDPEALRAVADVFASRGIPFSVAVYPAYRDPRGAHNHQQRTSKDLKDVPGMVQALAYLQSKRGTLVMHGYSHQFEDLVNPYSGTSADDFEFFRAHIDAGNNVVLDGPVPGDSKAWTQSRLQDGLAAFAAAGQGPPTIFEPPHYSASAEDYLAIQATFGIRYDRGLYFPGFLSGATLDYQKATNQFFPYLVRDVYGSLVIPENLGNVIPMGYNNHPALRPEEILNEASKNMVIRDGFASFFYHPRLGTGPLVTILDGLVAQGWTFVSAATASE